MRPSSTGTPSTCTTRVHDLQYGPLSLLVAGALPGALLSAGIVACLAGALWLGDSPRPSRLVLFAGPLVALSWAFLVATGHIDDAMAVLALAGAAAAKHRPPLAVALVIVAAASKPWAVCMAPALGVVGWGSVAAALGGAVLVYVPFVLAGGLLATVTFHVAPDTLLGLMGVDSAPAWWRAAQLVVTFAVAALFARRGWWPLIVAVTAVKVVLDPGSWPYFAAPLAVAGLACDIRNGRTLPVGVLGATGVLLTMGTGPPALQWAARAVLCGVCVAAARPRGEPGQRPAQQRPAA